MHLCRKGILLCIFTLYACDYLCISKLQCKKIRHSKKQANRKISKMADSEIRYINVDESESQDFTKKCAIITALVFTGIAILAVVTVAIALHIPVNIVHFNCIC